MRRRSISTRTSTSTSTSPETLLRRHSCAQPDQHFYAHFFSFHPIYFPRNTLLALPPSSNSDPGSHSGPSSPLPTTVHASILVARRIEYSLPSSTRVELYPPTLLGGSQQLIFFLFCISANKKSNIPTVGIELKDQRW